MEHQVNGRGNEGRSGHDRTVPTVVVRGLTRTFGSTRALDSVDLDVRPGVTGLLGPNGAGKTTLLRILATVASADAGTAHALGHDLADADGRLAVRRALGYVPQEPGFYNSFTAAAYLDYLAILKEHVDRRARATEVQRVLALVGLEDVAGRKVRALSGGMRQRLIVAQALLGDPELLILDEPTNGLDPEQRLRFRQVVSEIADRQTVLLSTHQTEDVSAMCDRVVVIDHGRVRFSGTPSELADQAAGHVWAADAPDPGAELSWRGGDGRYRLVGDPPEGAQLVPPTLEDGYLRLVGRDAATVAAVAGAA